MHDWGWRIAFVIGAAAAVTVMWLRRTMDESENFNLAVEAKPEHRTRQLEGLARVSARVLDRGGSDPRRHHRVLHVHHVHAEVHDQHDRLPKGR